jgi:hypothetical protein
LDKLFPVRPRKSFNLFTFGNCRLPKLLGRDLKKKWFCDFSKVFSKNGEVEKKNGTAEKTITE